MKLDENLPADALTLARALGHEADSVNTENLVGASDLEVLAAAGRDARFLLTVDRGFGDIRAYPPGTHAGIGILRLDSDDAGTATEAVRLFLSMDGLDDLAGCIVVMRGGLLRVRRPE